MAQDRPLVAATGLLVIAVATLAGAWGFQLIGGYLPCELCLWQRWPWYATAPLALAIVIMARAGKRAPSRIALAVAGMVVLVGAGLAFYHVGIEESWWKGPASCTGGAGLTGGLPDLDNIQLVLCDEVRWRMFGLSFAGWNVVISLASAMLAFWGAFAGRDQTA